MSKEKTAKQSADNIELRTEEVQEILGRPPRWIIRWGIGLIFILVAVLLVGSFFFQYPDMVTSEVTITTEHPAVWVVSRSSGKIQQLFVSDGQLVKENEILAVVENPASLNDIQQLEEYLSTIAPFFNEFDPHRLATSSTDYSLGGLQSSYSQLYTSIKEYLHFNEQRYHEKKLKALQQELRSNISYKENLLYQEKLNRDNLEIVQNQYSRDSSLYHGEVVKALSLSELEASRKQLITAKQALEQAKMNVSNGDMTIDGLRQDIVELEQDYSNKLQAYRTAIKTSYDALSAAIGSWKQQYILRATSSGVVTFGKFWSQNQQINAGDKVFGIVAESQGEIIGKVQLPSEGAGKVKVGQRVNIKLDGYPYMEYGMLAGIVQSISLVPDEKLYSVQLSLPNGMTTFYGKEIEFTGELTGTAEIATDDMSLFQRLLNPLKHFLKNSD